MKVVLAQINPKLNRESNLKEHLSIIKKSVDICDLIIFPELSLNGYLLMDAVYSDSFLIDELDEIKELSRSVDILLGCALKKDSKIYNSAIYFSNSQYFVHNKTVLPNYGMFEEARFFFEGDNISSFNSSYGKNIVAICEDVWSSKNIDKIVSSNPDNIFVIAASPARGFMDDSLQIERQWVSILNTLAILSGAYVFFVNRVGFEDGLGFWGKSRIINPKGLDEKVLPFMEEFIDSFVIDYQLSKTEKYMKRELG